MSRRRATRIATVCVKARPAKNIAANARRQRFLEELLVEITQRGGEAAREAARFQTLSRRAVVTAIGAAPVIAAPAAAIPLPSPIADPTIIHCDAWLAIKREIDG